MSPSQIVHCIVPDWRFRPVNETKEVRLSTRWHAVHLILIELLKNMFWDLVLAHHWYTESLEKVFNSIIGWYIQHKFCLSLVMEGRYHTNTLMVYGYLMNIWFSCIESCQRLTQDAYHLRYNCFTVLQNGSGVGLEMPLPIFVCH